MIILYLFQNVSRSELLVVVDEDICSGNPLSVELSPHGLAPACIGDSKVKAVFVQIMSEAAGNDMAQRIGKVMCHHFRFAGGAGSEIH